MRVRQFLVFNRFVSVSFPNSAQKKMETGFHRTLSFGTKQRTAAAEATAINQQYRYP